MQEEEDVEYWKQEDQSKYDGDLAAVVLWW